MGVAVRRYMDILINPRQKRREGYSSRLVCMYVCHAHAILAVRGIKSVTKDTVGNIIMVFFLKLSYSKVRASFTHLGRGGHL